MSTDAEHFYIVFLIFLFLFFAAFPFGFDVFCDIFTFCVFNIFLNRFLLLGFSNIFQCNLFEVFLCNFTALQLCKESVP